MSFVPLQVILHCFNIQVERWRELGSEFEIENQERSSYMMNFAVHLLLNLLLTQTSFFACSKFLKIFWKHFPLYLLGLNRTNRRQPRAACIQAISF